MSEDARVTEPCVCGHGFYAHICQFRESQCIGHNEKWNRCTCTEYQGTA